MSLPDFRYKQVAVHVAGGSKERLRFLADTIVIEDEEGKVLLRHSCHRLFALFIIGECSLTSVVIRQAIKFAFPIILMNRNLKVVTRINCAAEGNTLLRKQQYASMERDGEIARALVLQKIANQAKLIENLRYRSQEDNRAWQQLRQIEIPKKCERQMLLGIEGNASKLFFEHYFRPLDWKRREPRCRRDIPNFLLDIGYTYLFNFVESLLSLYGFDLYCGVYHTFFYQRQSLVCDLVEPFRCIIDRRLRKAHNLNQIDASDFIQKKGTLDLSWGAQGKYTKLFLKDILEEKEHLFVFIQTYYRWFVRNKPIEEFPIFKIGE